MLHGVIHKIKVTRFFIKTQCILNAISANKY